MYLVAFAVLGRLVTWTLQTNGLILPLIRRSAKFTELFECDFCLGFWVFSLLAWVFGLNLLAPIYIPVLSEATTGLFASFVAHLARLGWEAKFTVVNLGEYHDE